MDLKMVTRISLMIRWLRVHPPMQGTQVQCLVREDPTCLEQVSWRPLYRFLELFSAWLPSLYSVLQSPSLLFFKFWTLFTPSQQDICTLIGLPLPVLHSRKCFQTDILGNLGAYLIHFPSLRGHSLTLTFVQGVTIILLYILSRFLTACNRRTTLVPGT